MLPNDPMDLRRQLALLHLALCLGCAAFMGVTAFLWSTGTVPLSERDAPTGLSTAALTVAVGLPLLAMVLFRQRIRNASPGGAPQAQDMHVRAACVLHWALIEAALFFNLVVFMLHADTMHWGIAAALLCLMVLRAPTERRMQRWTTGTP
jgi:hypothetical protein